MTKYDRLRALVRYMTKELGLADNQAQLGEIMGYPNASYFSQIVNGKVATPRELSAKIKELVPNASIDWIETGDGDMLIGNVASHVEQHDNSQFAQGDINNNDTSSAEYIAIIKKQQEQMSKQQEQMDRLIELLAKNQNNG